MKLFDIVHFSIKNLYQQKLRTFLTIIGIVIGIGSVVFLVSLSNSLQIYIDKLANKMGEKTLTILPIKMFGVPAQKYFDDKIIRRLENLYFVKYLLYGLYIGHNVEYNGEKKFLPVFYYSKKNFEQFFEKAGYLLTEGRYIRSNDRKVCILGFNAANKLFDKKVEIGDMIVLNGTKFRVIGILEPIGDQQDDYSVIVPLDYAPKKNYYNVISIYLKEGINKKDAEETIAKTMKRYFGDSFSILSAENIAKILNSILGTLSFFITGAAAISLIVGAIGISNTMHMAVLERKREIGILKAIGAENETILAIFTIESGFLGLIGGLIGIILGFLTAYFVCLIAQNIGFKDFTFWWSLPFSILILVFSFIVGIVSGFFPAKQAANLNPVEVLREE